jgi:hypothetical protein
MKAGGRAVAEDPAPGSATADGARPLTLSERLERGLQAVQTPRQQEIARRIFSRLKAGDSVEDIRDLIVEMSRVVTEEQHLEPRTQREPGARQPGARQPEREGPPPRAPENPRA